MTTRIMVVTRLFSGLAESVAGEEWRPSGVPAIYKLLEYLARQKSVELLTVFTVKDYFGGRFASAQERQIPEIGSVVVLPWGWPRWLAALGLAGKLRELRHIVACLRLYRRFRPDICYFTNANFIAAGIFARLRLCRVILRFLGLHPEQKRIATSSWDVQRWFYRAPFDQAICSMDGSGGPYYLPRLLSPLVKTNILLNGVERLDVSEPRLRDIRARLRLGGRPVVLLVGRLEDNKGVREFLRAVCDVLAEQPACLHAILVGEGSLRAELEDYIAARRATADVHLIGAVTHKEIGAYLAAADIYVSLNKFGSLSNANLEALAAGKCVVMLAPDKESHTDEETLDVLPDDVVVRIPRTDIADALRVALRQLIAAPERIRRYSDKARALADSALSTWDQRLATELALIYGGKTVPFHE